MDPEISELDKKIALLEEELKLLKFQKDQNNLNAELIVWGTDTAIWDWDCKSGSLKFSNPKSYLYEIGFEDDTTDIDHFFSLVHPDDRVYLKKKMEEYLCGDTEAYEAEYRIKTIDGNWKWLYDKGKAVELDDNGNPSRVLGIMNDITVAMSNKLIKQENEKHFINLFKFCNDGIRIVDNVGRIVEVNQRMVEICGYTEEQTKGMYIWDAIFRNTPDNKKTPEVYQMIKEMTLNTLNTGNYPAIDKCRDFELQRADGTIRIVNAVYYTVSSNDGGYMIYSIIRDISEYRKKEMELMHAALRIEESEKKFRLIAENTSDGIFISDEEGKILYVSPSYVKQLGYTNEENLEADVNKIFFTIHPEDRERVFEEINDAINKLANELTYTFRAKHKEGHYIWREDHAKFNYHNGKLINTYVICRDVSERMNKDLLINKLKHAIESAQACILITDAEGNIEYANPYFGKLTGYTPEDYLGKNPRILKSDFHDLSYYKNLWDTIKSGKTWFGEFQNITINGNLFWEQAVISPVKGQMGEITNFVAVKTDITELKKVTFELIQSREKAVESERLKMAFLNNISHEIRTPLNAITGLSQVIAFQLEKHEDFTLFANMINDSSKKLINIITNVIEISQIQSNQIRIYNESFNLDSLIKSIKSEFSYAAQNKGLDLIFKMPSKLDNVTIVSDQNKIFKILYHLLDNAIKFTSKGYVILQLELIPEGLVFKVVDTGIGISAELLEIIFEPFRQVEVGLSRNYGGSGIGLSLVKGFLNKLNGNIIVNSNEHAGTEFIITIPAIVSEPDQTKNPAFESKLRITQTVLIVEDDTSNYIFLAEVLKVYCDRILHAWNGKEAIKLCKEDMSIGLVLMDINMPIMDGYMATRQIKEIRPQLPVIAQSAYATNDHQLFFDSGFDDVICKPININLLYNTVKECLRKSSKSGNSK